MPSWFEVNRPALPAQPSQPASPTAPFDIRALMAARGQHLPAPGTFWGKIVDSAGTFANQLPKNDPKAVAMMRLQAIQQAHQGGFFGKAIGALTNPAAVQAIQQAGQQPHGFGAGLVPATEALIHQQQGPPPQVMQAASNGATVIPPSPMRSVRMTAPDGTEENVPEELVGHYQQQGATMSGY